MGKIGVILFVLVTISCSILDYSVDAFPANTLTGNPATNRIVGGTEVTDATKFPFQVTLFYLGGFSCGGSIITRNYVLTAAHCVYLTAEVSITVTAGRTYLSNDDTAVTRYCEQFIVHDEYNPNTLENDIALIKVTEPFVLTDSVQTIRLGATVAGDSATVSGWGRIYNGGPTSDVLQFADTYIIGNENCIEKLSAFGYDIFESNVCTLKAEGIGACHGDSGGPLTVNGIQVGIVSWGIACALGYPDVFTRVDSHNDWIIAHSDYLSDF